MTMIMMMALVMMMMILTTILMITMMMMMTVMLMTWKFGKSCSGLVLKETRQLEKRDSCLQVCLKF